MTGLCPDCVDYVPNIHDEIEAGFCTRFKIHPINHLTLERHCFNMDVSPNNPNPEFCNYREMMAFTKTFKCTIGGNVLQCLTCPDREPLVISNSPAQAKRDKLKICFTCACYLYNKNTEPCKDCDGFFNNRWRAIK